MVKAAFCGKSRGNKMVNVIAISTPTGSEFKVWDIDKRVGSGSSGDDVRLVQYLMARTTFCGITVPQVDGIWGPITGAAMTALEANVSEVLADGVVDQMPFRITFEHLGQAYIYKLAILQFLYSKAVAPQNDDQDPKLSEATLMAMPDDGVCPNDLALALRNAAALTFFPPDSEETQNTQQ